ncbi:MAG: XTP/dITP diphosphatase [candidate division Zixibacteria bacterium]|nr:XTP/dITP diphosphatase [candidate division Zixibacteria bacterium]
MKIILATRNNHKTEEIKRILEDSKIEILTLKDFPDIPEIEETGKTLEENAVLKAKQVYTAAGIPALADDSGLEVEVLNGDPGVMSARFAGPGCSYKDNNLKLLGLLKGISREKRGATFRCVVALALNPDDIRVVEGKVKGFVTENEIGENGFGYDPVFFYPELNKTFAQLNSEEKNKVSHRGFAFRKAKELIKKISNIE